jgi:methionine-rich copper-binding protein CopC
MTHAARFLTLTLATLVLLFGVAPGPAHAHSKLVSTSPSDGAVLTVAPDEVVLTFDENLLQGTNTISINDDLGNVIITTPAEPQGSTIRAPWPADLPPGTYQVAYRIVSADGHPVTGAFAFELAEGTASAATVGPENTPSATAAARAASTAAVDSSPEPATPAVLWLAAIAAVTVALVAVAIVAVRRRRATSGE